MAKSGLYGRWDNNCHLKELINSTVDEAVCHAKEGHFFWASLVRNHFSFCLS